MRSGKVASRSSGRVAPAPRSRASKRFAKQVLQAAESARRNPRGRPPPCVVKADGLAAGKGVFVCRTQGELDEALRAVRSLGDFVVEELLEGDEVSLFALCDGSRALPLAPAQDFKRAYDGDAGPNTGGMGAYSPVPAVGAEEAAELAASVHEPVLAELARRDAPFVGLLYAGLMLTPDGPRVLEFNCRFGDPETQAILPRVEGDFLGALAAAAGGNLGAVGLSTTVLAAVTLALVAESYPAGTDVGSPIDGIAAAEETGALVFHAGTALRDDRLVTNGGRILNVGHRADARGRARARLRRLGEDPVSRHALPVRHRARRGGTGDPCRLSRRRPSSGSWSGSDLTGSGCRAPSTSSTSRTSPGSSTRSAHRDPDAVAEYAKSARERGIRVLICGAGLAAALPGAVAAHTDLP